MEKIKVHVDNQRRRNEKGERIHFYLYADTIFLQNQKGRRELSNELKSKYMSLLNRNAKIIAEVRWQHCLNFMLLQPILLVQSL